MDDIKALADSIRSEKIASAREQDPGDKLLAGPKLFEYACVFMRAGIRERHPDAGAAEVEQILEHQLDRVRQ